MSGPFPDLEPFEFFLGSLTLQPTTPEGYAAFSVGCITAVHPDGKREGPGFLSIWFSSDSKVTPEAVRRKLTDVLRSIGHPATDGVCDAILALLATLPQKVGDTGIARLNWLLRHVGQGELSQYFAFQLQGNLTIKYEVAGFAVGPLDFAKLSYRSKKAGSNYADVHRASLANLPLSISRLTKVKVVAWEVAVGDLGQPLPPDSLGYVLIDKYYHEVAEALFERFFDDFKQAQLLPQALGASWLSVDLLLRLAGSARITIFQNIGGQRHGWVVPTRVGVTVQLGAPHIGVPFVVSTLEHHFGPLRDGPVDKVIRTYCGFLADAVELKAHGRSADAFLYHVIALDLLLGEKGSSTASVTKRAALLAHTGLGVAYSDLLKTCDLIYEARSKYVHAGKAPDPSLLGTVEEVSREIALGLFRLRATGVESDEGFRDAWVKRVDVLIAKMAADDAVSQDELWRVGGAADGHLTYLELLSGLQPKASASGGPETPAP